MLSGQKVHVDDGRPGACLGWVRRHSEEAALLHMRAECWLFCICDWLLTSILQRYWHCLVFTVGDRISCRKLLEDWQYMPLVSNFWVIRCVKWLIMFCVYQYVFVKLLSGWCQIRYTGILAHNKQSVKHFCTHLQYLFPLMNLHCVNVCDFNHLDNNRERIAWIDIKCRGFIRVSAPKDGTIQLTPNF